MRPVIAEPLPATRPVDARPWADVARSSVAEPDIIRLWPLCVGWPHDVDGLSSVVGVCNDVRGATEAAAGLAVPYSNEQVGLVYEPFAGVLMRSRLGCFVWKSHDAGGFAE